MDSVQMWRRRVISFTEVKARGGKAYNRLINSEPRQFLQ
jgi:hypothetical protein